MNSQFTSQPKQRSTRRPKNTAEQKKWWKLIPWILIILGFAWWLFSGSYASDLEETVSQTEAIQIFEINIGTSLKTVSQLLEDKKLIISASSFLKYMKIENIDEKMLAGEYRLSPDMTIPEIANIITTKPETIKILIPEGYTLDDMDKRFAEKGYFTTGEFNECITSSCDFSRFNFLPSDRTTWEGYFFPATYTLQKNNLTPKALGEQMLSAFSSRIQSLNLDTQEYSLHDILIMASMIEKEASSHEIEEMSMISGILWNRIDQGMPLGVDATTRYAISKSSAALTKTDLRHDGPFNTRLNKGFPPHSISSPGDTSLKAALTPSDTSYLFYLHDQSGTIHYARTNAQHEQNKSTYCGGSCE